jgi:prevent-host-death family protein
MKRLPVGELKAHFSEILEDVRAGEKVIITYGKKKEDVAVLIPYHAFGEKNKIELGLLSHKSYNISDDFYITEEEFIGQ